MRQTHTKGKGSPAYEDGFYSVSESVENSYWLGGSRGDTSAHKIVCKHLVCPLTSPVLSAHNSVSGQLGSFPETCYDLFVVAYYFLALVIQANMK